METVDVRVGYMESVISPHVLYECETWSLMLGGIWIEGVQNMDTKTYLDFGERNKVALRNSYEGHPENKDRLATKKNKNKNVKVLLLLLLLLLQTLSYFTT
jgi:hypothetical protein